MDIGVNMKKFIEGYGTDYTISDTGIVHSFKNKKVKEKCPTMSDTGYWTVKLYNNNKGTTAHVHRLVAEAYIERESDNLIVNHKNGIKTDNSVSNLEWCTYSENIQHAYDTGLNKNKGSNHYMAKLNELKVSEIKLRIKTERGCDLAKEFGVTKETIYDIEKERYWKQVKPMDIDFYNNTY